MGGGSLEPSKFLRRFRNSVSLLKNLCWKPVNKLASWSSGRIETGLCFDALLIEGSNPFGH